MKLQYRNSGKPFPSLEQEPDRFHLLKLGVTLLLLAAAGLYVIARWR